MKKNLCFAALLLCATAGFAMPIASSARSMVPSEIQQLIGVDYRALKDSPTAQALKAQVLPDNLKELETRTEGHRHRRRARSRPAQFRLVPHREKRHSDHRRGGWLVLRQGRAQEDEAQEDHGHQVRHRGHLPDG